MGRCRESAYWQGQDIPESFRYSSAEDSNSQPEVKARAGNLASTPATLYLLAHPASQAGGMGQEALLHVLSSGLWPQALSLAASLLPSRFPPRPTCASSEETLGDSRRGSVTQAEGTRGSRPFLKAKVHVSILQQCVPPPPPPPHSPCPPPSPPHSLSHQLLNHPLPHYHSSYQEFQTRGWDPGPVYVMASSVLPEAAHL